MRKFFIFWFSCLFCFTVLAQSNRQRPNIIIFLVDDMGWQDCSLPFADSVTKWNRTYRTPNLERLASGGTKFTNAYATPVCSPTRVSLMTGMNAARHRVTNWVAVKRDNNTNYPDSLLENAAWNLNGLSPQTGIDHTVTATTLAQLLSQSGYATIHVGKAHFASRNTPGADPLNLGFDVNIAGGALGHPASYYGKKDFGYLPGKENLNAVPGLEKYYGQDIFLTEALTLEAIGAVRKSISLKNPFFLYLSHYAIHAPIQADPRFVDKYYERGLDSMEARYASLIEGMDKSLGDILNFLEKEGLSENTFILFMSDNGGLSLSPPRAGTAFTHNTPLRAGKGSLYEGGIRVPMVVKWPGVTRPGSIANQYVMVEDIFPGLLEVAGVTRYRVSQQVDGKSFLPELRDPGTEDQDRYLVWHYPNKWINSDAEAIAWYSAIRKGKWKLLYNQKTLGLELYDLSTDLSEKKNLANLFPEKVKELATILSQDLRDKKALMPINKRTGHPVPYPDEVLR